MGQKNSGRWANFPIFGMTVFLVFCLLFESFLELPPLVGWLGHWHPLVLHFPIVLLLLVCIMGLLGKKVSTLLLTVTTLSALLTAITGFFLGSKALPKGNLLLWHQWLGAAVALLAVIWYWLRQNRLDKRPFASIIQVILIVLVGITGHYGGMVTHGEDFLALPIGNEGDKIPEDPFIYGHVVVPILENKCVSCHNPNKRKGELLMTDLDQLLIGGGTGPAIVANVPEKSLLLQRVHLPVDDEEHMPPDGKEPLTEEEIAILERWIALGASDTLRLTHLKADEPLSTLIKKQLMPQDGNEYRSFPKMADSVLLRLGTDYLTLQRISANSNALAVAVFLPPQYDPSILEGLREVALNIVSLDLSGLPLGPQEMEIVSLCRNLERLELDRTLVNDAGFKGLQGLTKLKLLKAYDTDLTDASMAVLQQMEGLQQLYVWDTQISGAALSQLKDRLPALQINTGIDPGIKESFIQGDTVSLEGTKN
ncbi:MAG: c-type cytochrome domain-containing protein [Sediminicola sp.]